MTRILVTGGAGFIGSFLVDKLIEKGHEVTILDNLDPKAHPDGKPDYLNKKALFIKGDARDNSDLKEAIQDKDIIFHKAATVGITQSNYQITDFVSKNSLGTANLLDYLINKENSIKKLIIPGSNTSYGEGLYFCSDCNKKFHPDIRTEQEIKKYGWEPTCPICKKPGTSIPTPESTELKCNSIYSYTKRDQEDMSLLIGKMYGLPVSVLRYFNVYGPRQSLNNPYTGVAAIFTSRIKHDNIPFVYEDGLQTRDFISVHDVVDADIAAMNSSSADYEKFNIGSGNPTTIKQVAETIAEIYNKDISPQVTGKFRKGDIRHCKCDNSKAKERLDWKPKIDFKQGMKELIDWSKKDNSKDNFEKARKELEDRKLI